MQIARDPPEFELGVAYECTECRSSLAASVENMQARLSLLGFCGVRFVAEKLCIRAWKLRSRSRYQSQLRVIIMGSTPGGTQPAHECSVSPT